MSSKIDVRRKMMGKKIIIEGPRITHKTELASMIATNSNASLISGEWCVFHEPYQPYVGPSLINIKSSHTGIILKTYYYLVRIMQIFRYQTFVIDRFHISAQFFQKKLRNQDIDFGWLEDMLLPLDTRIIFCTRDPETYEDALQKRLLKSNHPELYPSNSEEFARDQEIYRELIKKSRLKSIEVDVTDGNVEQMIQKIAWWMKNE